MSNIQATSSFSFHDNNIRVQGTPDEPLFCLADVCKTLDLTSPNKVVAQIKEEFNIRGELNSGLIKDANNHTQTATFITEPQLYFVMMRSRAKLAKAFRQWIVNEVIPTIRKTGSYTQQENKKTSSYIQIFNQFCAEHRYSNEERAMFSWFKDQAVKQGYAIACARLKERVKPEEAEPKEAPSAKMLKDDEIAIPKATAKHIYEYLDWISKHRKEMMQTASDMREQSRTLMYIAECYDVLRAGVTSVIFKKL